VIFPEIKSGSIMRGGKGMKRNNKIALFISIFVLIGFPIIFAIVSVVMGDWRFFLYSIPGAFSSGLTGLLLTIQQIQKEKIHSPSVIKGESKL